MTFVLAVLACALFGAGFGAFISWFCQAKVDIALTIVMAVISGGCFAIGFKGWVPIF